MHTLENGTYVVLVPASTTGTIKSYELREAFETDSLDATCFIPTGCMENPLSGRGFIYQQSQMVVRPGHWF